MRIGTGLLIMLTLSSSPAILQGMRTAAADSSPAAAETVPNACRGIDAKLAHERADLAFRQSRYRQAGQCYLIAGDKPRADLSFVKAAAAEAPGTKRQMVANANQVKAQFRQFREALTPH